MELWLQLLIFHILFKETCFCNLTGFNGFQKPLQTSPLLHCFVSTVSPPSRCSDNENAIKEGTGRRKKRLIAATPEAYLGSQGEIDGLDRNIQWLGLQLPPPTHLSLAGFTAVRVRPPHDMCAFRLCFFISALMVGTVFISYKNKGCSSCSMHSVNVLNVRPLSSISYRCARLRCNRQ